MMHSGFKACLRVAQVLMYGDLCQMTYDNYIRTEPERKAVFDGLNKDQKIARNKFQTGCPMVGGFKYLPSELMDLPATNVLPPVVEHAEDLPPPVVEQVMHNLHSALITASRQSIYYR